MGRDYCVHMVRIDDDCDECTADAALDHTRGGVPTSGRLLHASPIAVSEHAELLRDLDAIAARTMRADEQTAARVAKVIRALEAEAQTLELRTNLLGVMEMERELAHVRADRDRLAGEVERRVALDLACQEQHELMEREIARLTSELAAAREDAERIDFASGPRIQVVQNDFIGGEWRVYRLHGPINDTHRTLISEGPTWREAVDAARSAGGGA